jgi:hypothetical protein
MWHNGFYSDAVFTGIAVRSLLCTVPVNYVDLGLHAHLLYKMTLLLVLNKLQMIKLQNLSEYISYGIVVLIDRYGLMGWLMGLG